MHASPFSDVRSSSGVTIRPAAVADVGVATALQRILTDLLGLALVAKHAHWNVTGPRFRALHLQLDELASAVRTSADAIAERAVALGAAPDGRPSSLADTPQLGAGPLPDLELIDDLLEHIEAVTRRAAAAIDAELARDLVSQSLAIDLVAELDTQAWMLAAQR